LKSIEGDVDLRSSTWIHARHVDFLDQKLVELAAGVLRDQGYIGLIVEEPPRHGKSELCSHYFPVWYLGARPDHRVILTSYEADFAASWGRKARNTLNEYGKLFGVTVDPSSASVSRWDILKKRGGMITAGVGGAITGRGGNLLICDDPVKSSQEANSETIRQRNWEWYTSTFRTRLEPDGIILVIGTRWHEDDLIGRILANQDDAEFGGKFLRIRLPALAEEPDEEFPEPDPLGRKPGEPLFPERITLQQLEMTQEDVGPYVWASLYQQRPSPKEGALFSKEWFEVVPMVPAGVRMRKTVRRWDLAATDEKKGEDPDYSVGALVGMGTDGYFYILDVVRMRETPGRVERRMSAVARIDGRSVRIRMEQEPGSAGKLLVAQYGRTIFRGYAFRGVRSTGNKVLRAETLAAAAERGEVRVVKAAWNKEWFKELTRFPFVTHDDQVDATSGAFEDLTTRSGKLVAW
jgi:predicted phage terminase large subunit-like protein